MNVGPTTTTPTTHTLIHGPLIFQCFPDQTYLAHPCPKEEKDIAVEISACSGCLHKECIFAGKTIDKIITMSHPIFLYRYPKNISAGEKFKVVLER